MARYGALQTTHFAAMVLIVTSLLPAGSAYFIPDSRDGVVKRAMDLVRDKRYTDTQERASSFCTGLCMYEERKAYSDCFDLCNWNGRGQSPWAQVDKGRKDGADNSVDAMASLYRTGANKGKGGDKGGKARGGRSGGKISSWDVNY